jgi:molecular chaperone GrpE
MSDQSNLNELEQTFPLDPDAPGALDEATELGQLREEAQAARDRALRAQAELENFRKRVQREQEDFAKYREVSLLTDLLPVMDNLDRAIDAASKQADASSLLQGVKMVSTQLTEVLAKHHCTRIGTVGEPFDPNVHQAIMQQPSDQPENTVLLVAASGYKVYDRTIRAAQVIVSKRAE